MKNRFLTFIFFCLVINTLFAQDKKKTIAVLDFKSGDLTKKELTVLSSRFRTILVKTQAFDVLERDKMSDILKEQDFVLSDNCNSAECAVQVGRLLGMELMVAGEVGKLGQTYSIDLRLVDVSTGKIIQTEAQDYKGEIDGLLSIMTTIANAFAGIKSSSLITNKTESGEILSDVTFIDSRDGKKYKTVKIGDQIWMAENLNYETETGSWCYDNNPSNCDKYGRLYDWETANKVAPAGWHLPSRAEFETLLKNLGGEGAEAYKHIIQGGSSGFNAFFSGYRGGDGSYHKSSIWGNGENTFFRSSTENEDKQAWAWILSVFSDTHKAHMTSVNDKSAGFSVRLVKD